MSAFLPYRVRLYIILSARVYVYVCVCVCLFVCVYVLFACSVFPSKPLVRHLPTRVFVPVHTVTFIKLSLPQHKTHIPSFHLKTLHAFLCVCYVPNGNPSSSMFEPFHDVYFEFVDFYLNLHPQTPSQHCMLPSVVVMPLSDVNDNPLSDLFVPSRTVPFTYKKKNSSKKCPFFSPHHLAINAILAPCFAPYVDPFTSFFLG